MKSNKISKDKNIQPDNSDESEIDENAVQIIETVEAISPDLFKSIPKGKADDIKRSLVRAISIQKSHSGPLPSPETLRAYADIIPDGAERIMKMAESEQKFRHTNTETVNRRMLNQSGMGQIIGALICFLAIGGGLFLAYEGKDTAGVTAIISALAVIVGGLFVRYKEKQ